MKKVLMVCLGNICRSPLAEGIMKAKALEYGIQLAVDSAGTSGYHAGELPDPRSIEVAKSHGLDILDQRSRMITIKDLIDFDYIFCMDSENLKNVLALCRNEIQEKKVSLLLSHDKDSEVNEVPDPYWGGGFEYVYCLIESACDKLCRSSLISL